MVIPKHVPAALGQAALMVLGHLLLAVLDDDLLLSSWLVQARLQPPQAQQRSCPPPVPSPRRLRLLYLLDVWELIILVVHLDLALVLQDALAQVVGVHGTVLLLVAVFIRLNFLSRRKDDDLRDVRSFCPLQQGQDLVGRDAHLSEIK